MSWLSKIVPSIGLLIGIVFVAIGGVMGGSSAIKLALYAPVESPCGYPYQIAPNGPTPAQVKEVGTPEEYCKNQRKSERAYYVQAKKENIIDGGVFLIVGVVFWLIFRRSWRKNTSE